MAASIVALALTGCGSDEGGSKVPTAGGGDSSASASATGDEGELAAYVEAQRDWVQCLRDNGVDAPDPDARGRVDFGDGEKARALKTDPTFVNASDKCADKNVTVPESVEEANQPKLTAAQIKAKRDYAACMQENGVPDFPDPDPDGHWDQDNSGNVPEWDQSSADAQRATRICAPIIGDPTNPPAAKG